MSRRRQRGGDRRGGGRHRAGGAGGASIAAGPERAHAACANTSFARGAFERAQRTRRRRTVPVVAAALARAPHAGGGQTSADGDVWPTVDDAGSPADLRAPSEAGAGATSRSGCADARAQAPRGRHAQRGRRAGTAAPAATWPPRRTRAARSAAAARNGPRLLKQAVVVLVHSATKRRHRSRSGVAIQYKSRRIASSACAALQRRRFTGKSMARLALIRASYSSLRARHSSSSTCPPAASRRSTASSPGASRPPSRCRARRRAGAWP